MGSSIRIALLGNFTTDYIAKAVVRACQAYGISAGVYHCPFNQYNQDVFNPVSPLYKSNPELAILMLEGSALFPEWYEAKTVMGGREKKLLDIESALDSLTLLIETLHTNCAASIIVNNFAVPYFSPMGLLDSKYYPGLRDMVSLLNIRLSEWASDKQYVYICDYRAFSAYHGEVNLSDPKLFYMTRTPMRLRYAAALAREYMRYILPLKFRTKKCLVLDLDHTLWGGSAGEDGLSGVKLDVSGAGRCYYDFQKEILGLYYRGVILALNSKNNFEDAMHIIENHPHMVLKKGYFSAMRINWQDKAKNMAELAEELKIGTDSMVFFDDSVYERELVKSLLPEVTVIEVPADAGRYPDTIRNLIEFEQLQLTGEDLSRNALYAGNRRRDEAQKRFASAEEFIKSLETIVILEASNDFTIPRIAQLTQKTNQFNLTTRRYTQEDITAFHHSKDHIVLSIRVTDVYGDNGLTGVCIVRLEDGEASVDTFLLSCRVMGRNVEYAFLSKVVDLLRARGVKTIRACYIKTEKNEAAMSFYQNAGFTVVSADEAGTAYSLDASRSVRSVDIETVMKGDEQYER